MEDNINKDSENILLGSNNNLTNVIESSPCHDASCLI